jgi:asparagine synthase (glutamine-hydrolysing)
MCGIAGFHSPRKFPQFAANLARKMGDELSWRGPDGAGEWVSSDLCIALAFRRLAIIDLSKTGEQPMASADGRFTLVMNGEIYNHRALRAELETRGRRFLGNSDTEVLLGAISEWGLEDSLSRCVGMYAIALVDAREQLLLLARDRLGEKPLYYGWSNNNFFFGSELKAFRTHPDFHPRVDRGALTLYLRHSYVPSPHCIFEGFHKLLPGHILSLSLSGNALPGKEVIRPYWSLPKPDTQEPSSRSSDDCVEGLEALLKDAIRMQVRADVPVGAFLSGGIDSSTVVSLMQAESSRRVKTFSIGFTDARMDESGYAEQVASYLGTEHITWQCVDSELLELAGLLPQVYSEPFADDSQLPTLALARLARQSVTVCLSGDGGDELFLGYGRYAKSLNRWRQITGNSGLCAGLRCGLDTLTNVLAHLGESPLKRKCFCKLNRVRKHWLPENLPAYYSYRMATNKGAELYLNRPEAMPEFFDEAALMPTLRDDLSCLSYLDLNTYLPDDILVKVDRAAMAFSLETRIPFLDHRVVEYACKMPESVKRHEGKSKWPLRQILKKKLPAAPFDRPKMGFSTPMDRWLRGPLREWGEAQLAESRLRREDFFDVSEVRRLWNEHQSGRRNRAYMLWGILMFQAWHETFLNRSTPQVEYADGTLLRQ